MQFLNMPLTIISEQTLIHQRIPGLPSMPEYIKPVSFKIMPRNHLNIIEPDDKHELLYFDKTWFSLGIKTAVDTYVDFNNVPKGTILLLRDITKGQEERIFMYENGEQIWW